MPESCDIEARLGRGTGVGESLATAGCRTFRESRGPVHLPSRFQVWHLTQVGSAGKPWGRKEPPGLETAAGEAWAGLSGGFPTGGDTGPLGQKTGQLQADFSGTGWEVN